MSKMLFSMKALFFTKRICACLRLNFISISLLNFRYKNNSKNANAPIEQARNKLLRAYQTQGLLMTQA